MAANQCEYHPVSSIRRAVLDACRRHRMVLIAHTPLGSGKLLADPVIADIAREYGRKPAQIILRWLVQQPRRGGDSQVVESAAHRRKLAVFDFELDAGAMARIGALARADGRVSKPAWHPEWDAPAHSSAADKP